MIDTIKLGIPLTRGQHAKLLKLIFTRDRWQWTQFHPTTGELHIVRAESVLTTDGESYHREIRWNIPDSFSPGTCLVVELSLPKLWYGHNIHLLYDWPAAVAELRRLFHAELRCRLPPLSGWRVLRLDCCYAWRFPSQSLAQAFLDSLANHKFAGKKPIIYPDAIFFPGRTLSLKIYLKLNEFRKHDRRELLKCNANLDWINYLESIADGVLRLEVTLRKQFLTTERDYLQSRRVETLSDLMTPLTAVQIDDEILSKYPQFREDKRLASEFALTTLCNYFGSTIRDAFISLPDLRERSLEFARGVPDGSKIVNERGDYIYIRQISLPVAVLRYMVERFIGTHTMRTCDKVKERLSELYQNHKAGRLLGFWMHVQRFGSNDARDFFGRDAYYRNRRSLKDAGISLVEPPRSQGNLVFLDDFRLDVPSQHCTNRVDDFRESANVLNLADFGAI